MNILDEKTSDIKFIGDANLFQLLCKTYSDSQDWMKAMKAMEVPGGCVVLVTTRHGETIAEALTFVPGVKIVDDINGGCKLIDSQSGVSADTRVLLNEEV